MIKLIIGLGNPGKQYERTRHNIGFMLVDALAKKIGVDSWKHDGRFNADIATGQVDGNKIVFAKPATFMNKSGDAVRRVAGFHKIEPSETLVAADDLNLDLGKVRLRLGGSDGGHNGLKSVIEIIGEDFWRMRMGIGFNENKVAEDYVLEKIPTSEMPVVERAIDKAVESLISSNIAEPIEETIT
ncbi:MAG TPA: aminoacyl-tRNA hydrolase [Patescibacteria group bacterium]|nr:aminoacyl-tRNA hydrolase [Patescibacteria group bacterium]